MSDALRDSSWSIDVPSAPRVLAADLRERILSGAIAEGVALPSERELVEQTELSRAHVRLALTILETEGLVEQRAGKWLVRLPGADEVAAVVSMTLRANQLEGSRLLELRQAIEPQTAALAAVYRDRDDLARIDKAVVQLDHAADTADIEAYVLASREWHVSVAAASHHVILLGVFSPVADAIVLREDVHNIGRSNMLDTAHVHRSIVQAVRDGDPNAARGRMAQHVGSRVEGSD